MDGAQSEQTAETAAERTRKRTDAIDRSQPDWYKDAVIYQLHIKAFYDALDHWSTILKALAGD